MSDDPKYPDATKSGRRIPDGHSNEGAGATAEHAIEISDVDFLRDLVNIARAQLVADGFETPSTGVGDDVLYRWLHFRSRVPIARPRTIHKSREFCAYELRAATELREGLELVERKLAAGETIYHHLSREIRDADFHDRLLDDWDIQHLHLGTDTINSGKNNGMIRGTREVIYCVFEANDVYFINVAQHEFCDPELLEIVNANWPQLLIRAPLYPPRTPTGDIRPSTIESVRMSRVEAFPRRGPRTTSLVTLRNGAVVMPRGDGFTISGHSVKILRSVDEWRTIVEQWEHAARSSVDKLVESAKERGIEAPSRLRLQLWHDEGGRRWCAAAPDLEINLILPTEYGSN